VPSTPRPPSTRVSRRWVGARTGGSDGAPLHNQAFAPLFADAGAMTAWLGILALAARRPGADEARAAMPTAAGTRWLTEAWIRPRRPRSSAGHEQRLR
jgi:hypothetical protein